MGVTSQTKSKSILYRNIIPLAKISEVLKHFGFSQLLHELFGLSKRLLAFPLAPGVAAAVLFTIFPILQQSNQANLVDLRKMVFLQRLMMAFTLPQFILR